MPEFKVVVNDPEARDPRVVWVKVTGVDELKYTEEHKEGRALPEARLNPKTLELLDTPYKVVTLRIWRNRAANDKVKFTFKVVADEKVPENIMHVPKALLTDKLGQEEAVGEVFRAKAFQVTLTGDKASAFLGRKIGETVDASVIGIGGKKLLITGGSDFAGFPMVSTLPGSGKKALLLSGPPGFHPRNKGERRRKYVRGNTVSEEIVQINTKLISA
ncbi:MAG: 30S ribosomal protein S6e [Desulfurococcales archaeon]|nr:30S ribosomal protein S6e [Desulfurococcales archaeon]